MVELPKADRLGDGDPALAAWVAFLEHWQEQKRMEQIDYPPVQQALQRIRDLSADEETRRLAFVRESALRDERSALSAAREEGRIQGEAHLLARQLLRRFGPLDANLQARLSAATPDQLERWADRILDSPTLEAVFQVQ